MPVVVEGINRTLPVINQTTTNSTAVVVQKSFFETIWAYIQNNFFTILVVGALLWLAYEYFVKRKKPLEPLNRSEIERENFIRRMKLNTSSYRWFYRGSTLVGEILGVKFTDLKNIKSVELVLKPPFLYFTIPLIHYEIRFCTFTKKICVIAGVENIRRDAFNNSMNISPVVTFDQYLGIFYDRNYFEELVPHIRDDTQFRTDWELMSSAYYAKAQEMAVYDPALGYRVLMEQIKLEQEKERRAMATSGQAG